MPVQCSDYCEKLWYLAHRVDLHNELKLLALGPQQGVPTPTLHLSSTVTEVDAEKGVVVLANGQKYEADLIVGADGLHVSFLTHESRPTEEMVR